MKKEKFIGDTKTVLKFIQFYCDKQHKESIKFNKSLNLRYLDESLHVEVYYSLCSTCRDTFLYSYERLQECFHDEKPSCRKCPKPCYEKPRWKHMAKIMRFSGARLGLKRIKKLFTISK